MLLPAPLLAQESGDAPVPAATPATDGKLVFTPADFARFAPKSALDMLNQVPGFSISGEDQGRGLGQASTNVLINGERLALKSESVFDPPQQDLGRQGVRIEIVDGATLNIPGLSGQVANIVVSSGGLSGQFRWDTRFRPDYVRPRWFGGSVSINGSTDRLEYTLALSNPGGRGAARGPNRNHRWRRRADRASRDARRHRQRQPEAVWLAQVGWPRQFGRNFTPRTSAAFSACTTTRSATGPPASTGTATTTRGSDRTITNWAAISNSRSARAGSS
jgi:hypothetical protein